MKPQYIFSAVIAVCLMMAAFLPQIGPSQAAAPLAAAAGPDSLAAAQAAFAPAAATPTAEVAVVEEAVPTLSPSPIPEVTIEEAPPESAPVEAPVFEQITERSAAPAEIPITADLDAFISSVQNNQANSVVGVYVEGLFALPVRVQPGGEENYVSAEDNTVTQYATPAHYGVVALLAHNYLSGRAFFQLRPGQEIVIIYGDRRVQSYSITSIQNYQAMTPTDVRSNFLDLNSPNGEMLSYSQLFNRVYTTSGTLVLQTCIEANGDLSWGRMFVVAEPIG